MLTSVTAIDKVMAVTVGSGSTGLGAGESSLLEQLETKNPNRISFKRKGVFRFYCSQKSIEKSSE